MRITDIGEHPTEESTPTFSSDFSTNHPDNTRESDKSPLPDDIEMIRLEADSIRNELTRYTPSNIIEDGVYLRYVYTDPTAIKLQKRLDELDRKKEDIRRRERDLNNAQKAVERASTIDIQPPSVPMILPGSPEADKARLAYHELPVVTPPVKKTPIDIVKGWFKK
jgi:hypothetical protein